MPCILPESFRAFREDLKEQGLTFASLRKMKSEDRIKLFNKHFNVSESDNTGEWFNKQYEQKLLLPKQREALTKWADKLKKKGLDTKKHKLLYDKIVNMKQVYKTGENRPFLAGLAKSMLGFEISKEDALAIYETSKTLSQMKKKLDGLVGKDFATLSGKEFNEFIKNPENDKVRLEYGDKQNALIDQLKESFLKTVEPNFWDKLAGSFTAIKATGDVSFGRQLTPYILTFEKTDGGKIAGWEAWKSGWSAMWGKDGLKGSEISNALKAQMYSHPYYLSGKLKEIGIDLGGQDTDFFPENFLTDKTLDRSKWTRWIKQMVEASERSMESSILMGKFLAGVAALDDANGNTKILKEQDFGHQISRLYGQFSPKIGNQEIIGAGANRVLRYVFFAPKFIMAQISRYLDIALVAPKIVNKISSQFDNEIAQKISQKTAFDRAKQLRYRSAVNTVLFLTILPNIMTAALQAGIYGDERDDDESYWDDFIDRLMLKFDPRSSNFGKLEIGKYINLDLSVGINRLISLTVQEITGQKRDRAGLIRKANRISEAFNYLKYKQSPTISNATAVVNKIDEWFISGEQAKDVIGQDLKDWQLLTQIFMPIVFQSLIEGGIESYEKKDLGLALATTAGVMADMLGISASVYDKNDQPKNIGKDDEMIRKEIKIHQKATKTESGNSRQLSSTAISPNSKLAQYLNEEQFAEAQQNVQNKIRERQKAYYDSKEYKTDTADERYKKVHDIANEVRKEETEIWTKNGVIPKKRAAKRNKSND